MKSNQIDIKLQEFLKNITNQRLNENKHSRLLDEIRAIEVSTDKNKESHSRIIGWAKSDLDYNKSDNYFNKKYLNELKKLTKGLSHKKRSEAKEVQRKLDELYATDGYWKSLITKSQHELGSLEELFEVPLGEFQELCCDYLTPSPDQLKETQRAYMVYPEHRLRVSMTGLINAVSTVGGLNNLAVLNKLLTGEDYSKIIETHVSSRWIFYDLTRVVLRKTYDNLYNPRTKHSKNNESEAITETSFVVSKTSVYFEYRKVLTLYLISCTLDYVCVTYGEQTPFLKENISSVLEIIRNFLWRKSSVYDLNKPESRWWTHDVTLLTHSFLSIYEETSAIKILAIESDDGDLGGKTADRNRIKYVLPLPFEPAILNYTQLPRVYIPPKPSNEDLDDALTPTLFGENQVSKNQKLKDILYTKQKKKFRVNEFFLGLLKNLINIKPCEKLADSLDQLALPFPTKRQTIELDKKIRNLEKSLLVSPVEQMIFEELHTFFVGENINNLYLEDVKRLCGFNDLDINIQKALNYLKQERKKETQRLKYANSSIVIAETFRNVPLYITNTFCVRMRLYPKQPLLSRTSGDFKQLLCDFDERRLTSNGLVSLMRCYYQSMKTEHLNEFEKFVLKLNVSEKRSVKKLYKFFCECPLPIQESEVFLYTSLLHCELLKTKQTNKTSVNVEIDQVASVLIFMALFFRNKKLATVTNLLGNKHSCPYRYIMNYMENNYEHSVEFSEKGYNIIVSDRKATKYTTMCFGYAQTTRGRYDSLIERAYEIYPGERDYIMEAYLREYSEKFPKYFNDMFPNITDQITILKKIVTIVVKETNEMRLKSFLGMNMSWKRYDTIKKKKKGFHPVTKEQVSFSVATTKVKNGTRVNSLVDHLRQILSYIIHSIDASVIQFFLIEMHDKHGVICNTLHDCVLLHPNDVDAFYEIAEKLYKSSELYNIAKTSFFDAVKSNVSGDTIPEIERLQNEFYALCDDFEDELQNIDVRACYKGEN